MACQTLTYHDVLQNGTVINDHRLMLYWIDPVEAAARLAAKPELAETFYFHHERQESEQRPAKRAFGRANSAFVFQEAQLIDMRSVPFIHLFYGDKSFFRHHRSGCWREVYKHKNRRHHWHTAQGGYCVSTKRLLRQRGYCYAAHIFHYTKPPH